MIIAEEKPFLSLFKNFSQVGEIIKIKSVKTRKICVICVPFKHTKK